MSTSKPAKVKSKYSERQKVLAQKARDDKKRKFNQDVDTYNLFNNMCNMFKPQEWTCTNFKQFDKPLEGDRQTKNRQASANSRKRAKVMNEELQFRIELLKRCLEPIYEPPLHFPFPFEEANIAIGGKTSTFGIWILTNTGYKKL